MPFFRGKFFITWKSEAILGDKLCTNGLSIAYITVV
jgi:hypothetical protein